MRACYTDRTDASFILHEAAVYQWHSETQRNVERHAVAAGARPILHAD